MQDDAEVSVPATCLHNDAQLPPPVDEDDLSPEELARAARKRLMRGRIITTVGIVILSFDTPTFRFIRTQAPSGNDIAQGLAATVWRGFCYCLAGVFVLRLESSSIEQLRTAFRDLGVRRLLFCTITLAGSNTCFPIAVALTTATNVLVILAMMPLACALMSRAIGVKLPLHTWLAAGVACIAVALCFASGIQAGPQQVKGCILALAAMIMFGSFVTMGSFSGAVSCVPAMPLAGVLSICICFAGLGPRWHYATPYDRADGGFLMLNGLTNAVANVMVVVGTQSVPSTEVSLIGLLETALGPVLTYLVTLNRPQGPEVPDTKSIAAGCIIVSVLVIHTLVDVRIARRAHAKELTSEDSVCASDLQAQAAGLPSTESAADLLGGEPAQ